MDGWQMNKVGGGASAKASAFTPLPLLTLSIHQCKWNDRLHRGGNISKARLSEEAKQKINRTDGRRIKALD